MIWIVDFGSQYTQLITRKLRELNFSSVIMTVEEAMIKIQKEVPEALVLSGGPQSVFEDRSDYSFFFENTSLPVLGVCYGMQIMGQFFNGKVEKGIVGEYGHSHLHGVDGFELPGLQQNFPVWMSHSDHVKIVPPDFKIILKSENGLVAGIQHKSRPIWGLQFHPEVHHTPNGDKILEYFFKNVAKLSPSWNQQTILESCTQVVNEARGKKILCAFSGGVDSLVAATLAHNVLPGDVYCFFVDNGLLRPQDLIHIETLKNKTDLHIEIIDAKELFYQKLSGVNDPEQKRKIIGVTFIEVFEQKVKQYQEVNNIKFDYLLQGTLYPDVIESISPHKKGGKSVTIKSHHNVGGLPERMDLKLLEPLRFLFKDEVRQLGKQLKLEPEWVHRHPFPGPGIGVRVLGELTPVRIAQVQHSDQILFEELKSQNLYDKTWQAFTVLLPVKTVGVKGDSRAYEEVIALRLVNSVDGMTATWTDLPYEFLAKVSSRICNEVKGITRVVYDITSKPPGTIEWE